MVNMPLRKRRKSRTSSESSGLGQCLICLRQDSNESLITCQLCANQFHSVKCLHMLPKTVNRIPLTSWSCPKCKSCEICGRKTRALRSAAENNLLLCKGCDRGFHRNCIHHHTEDDGLDLINESTWLCLNCEDKMATQGDSADESEEEEEEEEQDDEDEEEQQEENEDDEEEAVDSSDEEEEEEDDINIEACGKSDEESEDESEEESEENEVDDDDEDDDEDQEEEIDEEIDDDDDDDDEGEEENEEDEEEDESDESDEDERSDDERPQPRLTRSKAAAGRSICETSSDAQSSSKNESMEIEENDSEEGNNSEKNSKAAKSKIKRGRKRKNGISQQNSNNNNLLVPKKVKSEDENSRDEEEEVHCRVPGCDSKGHLSGKYSTHFTSSTCPVFHNLNQEECVNRYQNRLRRKDIRETNQKISTRKSPYKEEKINCLIEQRKKECNQIANGPSVKKNNSSSTTTHSITSREPKLKSLAPIFDYEMFREAQSRAAELMQEQMKENPPKKTGIRTIEMGKYEMDVWYSAPYPPDYACLPKLYICEFCLKYFNSSLTMKRHALKCPLHCPPGNEIYRKANISVFEIDGEKNKLYCQNLCLLAKLFLDHKTLYYDVEPFRFYIMTESDSDGFHIIGYFSKEKNSFLNYNVSCILTLPPYQKQGYGRMLIDFSYLLTRVEGKVGSPEKPLSDLGLISYRSYWKNVILEYLCNYQGSEISIKDLSHETAINAYDIVSTLQALGMLKYWKGKHLVLTRKDILDEYKAKNKKRKNFKSIDATCLKWTPPNNNAN